MARILIVDDDKFLHKVLEKILSIGGHDVVDQAYNGNDAILKYKKLKSKPDLVLMDHRMPKKNGVETTVELLALNSSLKVVFLSADETVREEALAAGAISFLVKPVKSKDLFSEIEEHMGK